MNDSKSVFAIKDYGKISLHLKEIMDSKKNHPKLPGQSF